MIRICGWLACVAAVNGLGFLMARSVRVAPALVVKDAPALFLGLAAVLGLVCFVGWIVQRRET